MNPTRLLEKTLQIRKDEIAAVLWAFVYFFSLLCGYYILRPVRDTMGLTGGVKNLPWLFTATLLVLLVASPTYSWFVARVPKRKLVPSVYHFFSANVLVFWALLSWDSTNFTVALVFFVWTSVYNVFVVSVFWSFMSDVFSNEQAKRLFAFIAGGGTVGALTGPLISSLFSEAIGIEGLLLVSFGLLQVAALCARRLVAATAQSRAESGIYRGERVGGSILKSLARVAKSPYLLGITCYVFIYTMTSTVLYFQQASIVSSAFESRASRTAFFANIDLTVNLLTLLMQTFLTARLIRRAGVAAMLAILPAVTILGFTSLSLAPILIVLVAFQSLRRASNYAFARPARELLYTVVSDEDKYKAKNLIDTVIYRGGDVLSGWLYATVSGLGASLTGIAIGVVPIACLWMGIGVFLGRKQETLRDERSTTG